MPTASPPEDPILDNHDAADGAEDVARPMRQRTSLLRRAVLNTAAQMFAEKGYLGTNLRAIADALGMSRPGLYYHFPSKERLLEEIIEELTLSAERQMTAIADEKASDPEQALRMVIHSTTLWLLDHRIYFLALDRSEKDLPDDLRAANEESKRKNLHLMVEIIEQGVKIGRFRPVDPHIAALAIAGMRNWGAWWYRPDGRLSAAEIADTISDMAVRSLLRPDAYRSRSDSITDALRILHEDVSHLSYLMRD
jgi:AcrR family transcriptional regulator